MGINTDELKSCAPLIPYVREHYSKQIPFVRENKSTVCAKCIWHEENTPSLALFANGTYKCFGCGEHGDIITLVRRMENLQFKEACKLIGDNVGYEVTIEEPDPLAEAYKDTLNEHAKRYMNNLQNNKEAIEYLKSRGITKETAEKFMLGLTDEDEYKYRSDMGGISGKISFPILEHKKINPKCLGMAYRDIHGKMPKYINDHNQDGREGQNPRLCGIFVKGNMLYGLPFAYDEIRERNCIIIVEGYFDVISLHQSDIKNSVGIMGTSLTDAQITTVSRLTDNVILFLDSDKAGRNAMLKSISALYKAGLNVSICLIEGGLDPADLCKSLNFSWNKVYNKIKDNTKQGINFILDAATEKYESLVTVERQNVINKVMPIINEVKNPELREMYRTMLLKKLDL